MKVYVGMSGGVDSSVTAALLQQQGHDVTGVYIKNWAEEWSIFDCPWADDLYDASKVAEQLHIPFKVFDLQQDYKAKVVEYLLAEYQAGRTPNPDVMCNQEMKFGVFLDIALSEGADAVATGHYARIDRDQLLAGVDKNKDQSYFLYRMKQSALSQAIMPIGTFTKPEVRAKAAELGLPTAAKKDSQGICFIGKVKLKDFLKQYITAEPGNVINQHGKIVGQHDGAIFYTIGQRQGLGIGGGQPYFVTGKDMAKNIVYVTTDPQDDDLWHDSVTINQLHWLGEAPGENKTYQSRVRYRAPLTGTTLTYLDDDRLRLQFAQPQRAIAPGQSAVIYDGERVVGGGIIVA